MIKKILYNAIYVTQIESYNKNEMKQVIDDQQNRFDKLFFKTSDEFFGDHLPGKQIHQYPQFDSLNKQIATHIKNFLAEITPTKLNAYVQKSWAIKVVNGGRVQAHTHRNADLSCVFYVDIPPNSGSLIFNDQNHVLHSLPIQYHNRGTTRSEVEVNSGTLVIFPSALEHEVPESCNRDWRYSVSYDLTLVDEKYSEGTRPDPKFWYKLD